MIMFVILILINIASATSRTTPATPNIECRGHSRKYKALDPDGNPLCVPCTSCGPGLGVLRQCTEYEDTVCEACEPGKTYSGTESTWRRCESCVQCAAHELRKRDCTPTRNGRCGACETGRFHNEITGDCDVCSWCYPDYPAITDFMSDCNVTGVTPGFQCAPILDAPYPPPSRIGHSTTQGYHATEMEGRHATSLAVPLHHRHMVGYVGEEHDLHGTNNGNMGSDISNCTPTETPPSSKDTAAEHLRESDHVHMSTVPTSTASQSGLFNRRKLPGQSVEDLRATDGSVLPVGAAVAVAVAVVTGTLVIIIVAVVCNRGRAKACLLDGKGSSDEVELPLSQCPTDQTPLVQNHEGVSIHSTMLTVI